LKSKLKCQGRVIHTGSAGSPQAESLAAHEQAMNKVMSDPKYMELLAKAADLFIPGSAVDEFWMSI